MGQYAYPTGDVSLGSWADSPLWSKLDDVSDADFISASGAVACELSLSAVSAPVATRSRCFLTVSCRSTGGLPGTLTVALKGPSVVATWPVRLTGQFVAYVRALTPDELSAVSDWGALSLTMAYTGTGGCAVGWARYSDEGTQVQMGEPLHSDEESRVCSVTGYLRPMHDLETVEGRYVWRKIGRQPRKDL